MKRCERKKKKNQLKRVILQLVEPNSIIPKAMLLHYVLYSLLYSLTTARLNE